jgi:hypothetical protein
MDNKLKPIGRQLTTKERVYVINKNSIAFYHFHIIEDKRKGKYYYVKISLISNNAISFNVKPENVKEIIKELSLVNDYPVIQLIEEYNDKDVIYYAKILNEIIELK